MTNHSTRLSRRRSAAHLVEFAFVLPVFLMVLMGIFEYGRFLFTIQLMNNAAREGARYAVVNVTTVSTTDILTYVDQYMAGQGAAQLVGYTLSGSNPSIKVYKADPSTGLDSNPSVSWQNAGWGDAIGVTVKGTYQPFTPGLLYLTGSVTLQASCAITCEAN
jgi:Flp pilus assembly protein TadG